MNNFFSNLQERLYQFMQGRYGFDRFAKFTLAVGLMLTIIDWFVNSLIITLLALVLLLYTIFRTYSRNIDARAREGERFDTIVEKPLAWLSGHRAGKSRRSGKSSGDARRAKPDTGRVRAHGGNSGANGVKAESTTLYLTCSKCGQSLSVPKGKGTLRVTCPKCHNQTTIKS